MVKAPLPGWTKTRLCPPLTETAAASLAMCFVQDMVNTVLSLTTNVIVAFTPRQGRAMLEEVLPGDLIWFEQQGATLGERLNSAIACAAGSGFSPIIVLGADSPTLPPSFIKSACSGLADKVADVALGPTIDGGYYLVGVRGPTPDLFENVTWSSATTFAETARNVRDHGLRLLTLEQWYDVDTPADLQVLVDELRANEDARKLAPATHEWLINQNHISLRLDDFTFKP